ncbi:hypothetical protein C1646_763289 [Rhizophagus diaphanus]|nr:hypothetical protein C1646_763289 [Rhizophagus diaphanus] [Rhizophagus sp. MUCL 43196]
MLYGERISILKAAINNLSAHVWHSINNLIKDSIFQKVARRCQLRFLVFMMQSYKILELHCALKPYKILNAIGIKWNVLDAIDTLMPYFFISTINGCQNFKIWLEIIVSNEVISYNEMNNRYKQFKISSAYKRVQSIKQACKNNSVEIQQPDEMDFSFDY